MAKFVKNTSSKTKVPRQIAFAFRRDVTLGSVVAETDQEFLAEAFIDTGMLDVLRNTSNPKSVVVGRTGAGKSALLLRLSEVEDRVVRVRPETLSLRYLCNSTIIPQLVNMGVRLDPFYQLLWRHVIVMEVIRHFYKLDSEESGNGFVRRVVNLVERATNAKKRRALEYYKEWSPSFWREADVRVKDITDTLREKVTAEFGGELPFGTAKLTAGLGAESGAERSVSQEIVARAQRVIDDVSLRAIHDGMEIVRDDVLTDPQKRYYIVIDDLDKNWVEIDFAYDLIDALLDAVAHFAEMRNIKVVVSLRENIVEALHAQRGKLRQQREKHRNLFLPIRWTPDQLIELMNARVDRLCRGRFGERVNLRNLLPPPKKRSGVEAVDYLLARTLDRPRDLIDFVNKCIDVAAIRSQHKISWSTIQSAEEAYSRTRLEALADEWYDNYSGIQLLLESLDGLPERFTIADLDAARLDPLMLEGIRLASEGETDPTSVPLTVSALDERGFTVAQIWEVLLLICYRIGVIGVKRSPQESVRYSHEMPDIPTSLPTDTVLHVHPALFSALHIRRISEVSSIAREENEQ